MNKGAVAARKTGDTCKRLVLVIFGVAALAACGSKGVPRTPQPLGSVAPPVPAIGGVSQGEFYASIVLRMVSVESGVVYEVRRSDTPGTAGSVVGNTSTTEFSDLGIEPDRPYYYAVRGCRGTTCSEFSPEHAGHAASRMVELVPLFNDVSAYRESPAGTEPLCNQGAICQQSVSRAANLWAIGSELGVAFQFDARALASFQSDGYGFVCSASEPDATCFDRVKDRVLTWAREWTQHGEITFVEKPWADAQITVAFEPEAGHWSSLGVGSRSTRPSMNLGANGGLTRGAVLHLFGHALGFEHEYRGPLDTVTFDEAAVVQWFARHQPQIDPYFQVLGQISKDLRGLFTGNDYDPKSVMHYWIPPQWVRNPQACPVQGSTRACVADNEELSATDKAGMAILYPKQRQTSVSWAVTQEISSGNGGPWGAWNPRVYCPEGQYAYSFQLRTDSRQGGGDLTAANSLRLYCRPRGSTAAGSPIASHPGLQGNWGFPKSCAGMDLVTGFQLRVDGPQGGGDDTAANDINMNCTGGYELKGGGGPRGSWGERKYCPLSQAVCGMQLKIQNSQGRGDDTALNDVSLLCCS